MEKRKVKRKKRRLNYRKILLSFAFLFLFIYLINIVIDIPIKNIYIYNNKILSDQQIIELAKIENYPATFKNLSLMIEKRLEKNDYIKEAKVSKKHFTEVHIEITDNYPIFINRTLNKTILLDGKTVDKKFPIPTLINIVPDTKYDLFLEKMKLIDRHILPRISEIEYDPNDVESNRFLFYMNDGNYVYLTLDKFSSINSYLEIIKNFENKKGILYLDYGNHFTIIDD
ncbi:MAG: FtsQ-type POTRA domain-containing protein [Bacilli bacterium]|nr:FtsQ-type POTRA domain-containing protein [Bacilli bacterium]MDD4547875.1 FtsQ-type POTRA domain-containing protein [Bacilli bacterium]